LDIVGDMRVGYSNNSSFLVNLGNTGVAGYRSGYLFGDGTDMKLANQQNGAMIFDANNVERMRILANGNVGIGTTAPGADFEVYRNRGIGGTTQMNITSVAGVGTTTNSSIMNLRVQGAGGGIVDNTISAQFAPNSSGGTYSLAFSPMGTTAMSVLGSGNVGIGTPAPTASLHIVNPTLQAGNPAMVTAQIIARPATGGVQNAMSCGFAIGAATSSINSVGRMNVMVAGAPVAGNDYGYIPDVPVATFLGNGAVGIGTTNPAARLQIVGSGGSGSPLRLVSDVAGNEVGIGFYRNPDQSIPTTGDLWVMGTTAWGTGDRNFGIGCNGTAPSLTLLANGNVGIGTNSPGARLHVATNSGSVTTPISFVNQDGYGIYANSGGISSRGNTLDFASRDFNGGSIVARDVMTLRPEGNVGINTHNPVYPFDVNGIARFKGTVGYSPAGASANTMYYWWTTTQFAFSVDGSMFYYVSPSSDYRIKENIQSPPPILSRLCAINMIEYEFKTEGVMKNDGKRLGVFAHELQEAFPEYPNIVMGKKDEVNEDGSIKIQSVAGEAIGYLVMKSVQELASQATSHATLVQELSTQLAATQQQLAAKSAALDALIAWAQTMGYSASM
jgi:hypothetical protein